jgi:hypothetical protein
MTLRAIPFFSSTIEAQRNSSNTRSKRNIEWTLGISITAFDGPADMVRGDAIVFDLTASKPKRVRDAASDSETTQSGLRAYG